MFDINIHPLPGTDEVNGDVHYDTTHILLLKVMHMHMMVTVRAVCLGRDIFELVYTQQVL
jgi:hypothetical protein